MRSIAKGTGGHPRRASPDSAEAIGCGRIDGRLGELYEALLIWHGFATDVTLVETCRGWPPVPSPQLSLRLGAAMTVVGVVTTTKGCTFSISSIAETSGLCWSMT